MNHPNQITEVPGRCDRWLPFFTGPPPATNTSPSQVLPFPLAMTMIFADQAGCSTLLESEIARLGKRPVVVHSPLNAIALLQSPSLVVDAVFVSLQDVDVDISAFFAFLKDEHPSVRRIAFAQHSAKGVNTNAVQTCQHDMILWDPWDGEGDAFGEAIRDALNCQPHRAESGWTDGRLFNSQDGFDRSALAVIIGRYKHRITSLAAAAAPNTADTEDIVQDTYLAIMRRLPLFDGSCSPGHWIDRMTRGCISTFLRRGSIGNIFHRRAGNRGTRQPLIPRQGAICT